MLQSNQLPLMSMKIAIVAGGQNFFGKEVIALELGQALHDRGHQVSFVSSKWCGDGEFGRRLQRAGIPARFMRLGFISATLRMDCIRMTLDQLMHVPGLWWDYARFLRQEQPADVIHTNWHHLLMLWVFLKPQRDWFWLHEVVPDKPQYRRVFQWLSKRLRAFIAVSNAVKSSLLRIGISENKIHVIYNGISAIKGADVIGVNSWSVVRIGIVGQVAPWKGHQDLIEAFGIVAKAHPEAELHIFGKGSQDFEELLRRRAEALEVDCQIVWHGFVMEKNAIYGKLDLCVMPSRFEEPFGLIVAECGMFGLPVIASRIGGLAEIVEDGVTGLLHESGNQTELAIHLQTLLRSEDLRKKMGASARRRAQDLFSVDRFVTDFEKLMRKPGCFLQ